MTHESERQENTDVCRTFSWQRLIEEKDLEKNRTVLHRRYSCSLPELQSCMLRRRRCMNRSGLCYFRRSHWPASVVGVGGWVGLPAGLRCVHVIFLPDRPVTCRMLWNHAQAIVIHKCKCA